MMNCEQFREIVHDLLRDERLDPASVEEGFSHAESCSACYAFFGEAELLHTSMRSLAARYASEQAPSRVQEALLKELAQKRAPVPARFPSRRFTNPRWRILAGGIAAAAVLLIFLMIHRGTAQPDRTPQPQALPAASTRATYEADALPAGDDESPADEESASGPFVPLSESFDPSSLDDATVVRVVLSRSALESLGLPSNESGDDQAVADLVVAGDGMPQAIRMVGWQVPETTQDRQ